MVLIYIFHFIFSEMSSMDAFIDEHEAIDLARACQDSKIFTDQKQDWNITLLPKMKNSGQIMK